MSASVKGREGGEAGLGDVWGIITPMWEDHFTGKGQGPFAPLPVSLPQVTQLPGRLPPVPWLHSNG